MPQIRKVTSTKLKATLFGLLFSFFLVNLLSCAKSKSVKDISEGPYVLDWSAQLVDGKIGEGKPKFFADNVWRSPLVQASFRLYPNLVELTFTNDSRSQLVIQWSKTYFRVPFEEFTNIIHNEVEYDDRLKPLPDRVIGPLQSGNFFFAPKSQVEWNGETKKWRSYPFYKLDAKSALGQVLEMRLSFIVKGKEQNILLQFVIMDARKIKKFPAPKKFIPPKPETKK